MVDPNKHGEFNKEKKMNKWLSFKMLSSVTLLVLVTVASLTYNEYHVFQDLWFCMWALCIVRLIDTLDEI